MSERCKTCGQAKKKRSDEEHGLLFGVIRMAAANWPEAHPFKPEGVSLTAQAEHLRAWLLIEAKHCDMLFIDEKIEKELLVSIGVLFQGGKRHFRLRRVGEDISLLVPRTINTSIKKDVFAKVADAVYEIIEDATGINPALYKDEQEAKKRRVV